MKLIHSFWSKPSFHGNQNFQNSRKFGGWLSYKYFLLSTCFSCLTLKRCHNKLSLYTDGRGADIFINQLNLPYDDISLVLDELAESDHRLWVLGKLKVISMQENPFLHVDNDVFLWNTTLKHVFKSPLIAQSLHLLPEPYKNNLNGVFENFSFIPECLRKKPTADTMIANIGLIGGNDIDFFQNYCSTAYELLNKNLHHLPEINIGGFNQIMDEYLFTCLANEKNRNIHYFVENPDANNRNVEMYEHVLRFHMVPILDKYIHVVGLAKQSAYACEQLELRFKYEFPKEAKQIFTYVDDNYPDPASEINSLIQRQQRILKSIDKLYNFSISDIVKMKVCLVDKIREVTSDLNDSKESVYAVKYVYPITGEEKLNKLKGSNSFLTYFESPISINDILEEVTSNENSINKNEMNALKSSMLSFVLEKIIISGELEFV